MPSRRPVEFGRGQGGSASLAQHRPQGTGNPTKEEEMKTEEMKAEEKTLASSRSSSSEVPRRSQASAGSLTVQGVTLFQGPVVITPAKVPRQ